MTRKTMARARDERKRPLVSDARRVEAAPRVVPSEASLHARSAGFAELRSRLAAVLAEHPEASERIVRRLEQTPRGGARDRGLEQMKALFAASVAHRKVPVNLLLDLLLDAIAEGVSHYAVAEIARRKIPGPEGAGFADSLEAVGRNLVEVACRNVSGVELDPAALEAIDAVLVARVTTTAGGRGQGWVPPFRRLWLALVGTPLRVLDKSLRVRAHRRRFGADR